MGKKQAESIGEEKMATIAEIKTKGTITICDEISFKVIVDALKGIFNCHLGSFREASWFPEGKIGIGERFVWFPKLSLANGQPVAKKWDNYFFYTEKYICEREMLTKERGTKICKGNPSHYNNPLDCIKSGKPVPTLTPEICNFVNHNFEWHSKEKAAFIKVNDGGYKFFGVYKFIGVQTVEYEKIEREGEHSDYNIKDKYINVFERTKTELIISDWACSAQNCQTCPYII